MEQAGPAFGRLLSVLDRLEAPPVEIAIVGPPGDEATKELIVAAHGEALRNVVVTGTTPEAAEVTSPLLQGRGLVDGKPAAYVCQDYACGLPATTVDGLRQQIAKLSGEPGI